MGTKYWNKSLPVNKKTRLKFSILLSVITYILLLLVAFSLNSDPEDRALGLVGFILGTPLILLVLYILGNFIYAVFLALRSFEK